MSGLRRHRSSHPGPGRRGVRRAVGPRTLGLVILAATPLAVPTSLAGQSSPPDFLTEFNGQFEASARKLVALAEAMPAATYDWSPGEGVASVARVYMHIARYNYMYPVENLGRDAPVTPVEYGRWEDEVTDKDDVVRILSESMQYVRDVVAAMDAARLDDATMLYGRQVGEWAVLLQLVAHMNEHLGQSIAYARMNGVVPPWSR